MPKVPVVTAARPACHAGDSPEWVERPTCKAVTCSAYPERRGGSGAKRVDPRRTSPFPDASAVEVKFGVPHHPTRTKRWVCRGPLVYLPQPTRALADCPSQ